MKSITSVILALSIIGCGGFEPTDSESSALLSSEESQFIQAMTGAQTSGTLAFVNDAATNQSRLDDDCALYSDAARQIIKHRDGKDRAYPSADDNSFDTVAELADVQEVGVANLGRIVQCAELYGFIASEDWILFEYLDQLEPTLAAAIEALMAEGNPCAFCDAEEPYSCVFFPVRFADVVIHTVGGVPVDYELQLVQMLDPEGGVQEWILYQLDASFGVLDYVCTV